MERFIPPLNTGNRHSINSPKIAKIIFPSDTQKKKIRKFSRVNYRSQAKLSVQSSVKSQLVEGLRNKTMPQFFAAANYRSPYLLVRISERKRTSITNSAGLPAMHISQQTHSAAPKDLCIKTSACLLHPSLSEIPTTRVTRKGQMKQQS